ncbi:hypothetical protein [Sandaracinus amylolyticus]|uniref:hypothetical protein n=1 Tax=Sandaracinus amylolyticus TaxID=927083 RepID=UPI001F2379B6|nr:hypothetical protein [Sandaracinus amylolyticus]UJR84964.1 Hypothetical protein I5071_70430 [Sandaracinus amylolyticus]
MHPHHHGTHFCRHCDHAVTPVRPGRPWIFRLALAITALGGVLAVLASSLIGPFIMFAVPLMALYGFALGPLHWLATMPAVCPGCRRETPYRSREEARASVPTRRPVRASMRAAA